MLVIQRNDLKHFKSINKNTFLLPASLPESLYENQKLSIKDYVLFHGNLAVSENQEAIEWLIKNVYSEIKNIHFKIAGSNPSEKLKQLCIKHSIDLIPSPTKQKMDLLISEARVHLLYTNQNTGLKLKLLSALISRGTVIANPTMVRGTDLGRHCYIAITPQDYIQLIKKAFKKPIESKQFINRKEELLEQYNTVKNCQIITNLCRY